MKYILYVVGAVFFCVFLSSCKKSSSSDDQSPTVITTAITEITQTTAQGGGNVTDPQYSNTFRIIARGLCWNTSPNPTIVNSKISNGAGEGTFSGALSFLQPNTKYYVRAYATINSGTFYGNEVMFITSAQGVPTIQTSEMLITGIHKNKYASSGTVISNGGAAIIQQGLCWSTSPNPTVQDVKISTMTENTIFGGALPRLQAKTTYYLRAFSTNSIGTGYGNQVTFSTPMAIGLFHAGGIIFELDGAGAHGWVAAPEDQGTEVPWAPGNLFIVQTNATSNSDGATNTTKIIATYGNNGNYAAKLCRDYRGGGYTDWYLPAAKEMLHLALTTDYVGGFPTKTYDKPFAYYWSSTEENYFRAWNYNVFAAGTVDIDTKNAYSLQRVRAIRTF